MAPAPEEAALNLNIDELPLAESVSDADEMIQIGGGLNAENVENNPLKKFGNLTMDGFEELMKLRTKFGLPKKVSDSLDDFDEQEKLAK